MHITYTYSCTWKHTYASTQQCQTPHALLSVHSRSLEEVNFSFILLMFDPGGGRAGRTKEQRRSSPSPYR